MRKLALTMCLALSLSSVAPMQPLYAAELDQNSVEQMDVEEKDGTVDTFTNDKVNDIASGSDSEGTEEALPEATDDIDREGVIDSGDDGGYGYSWSVSDDGKLTITDGTFRANIKEEDKWKFGRVYTAMSAKHSRGDAFWSSVKSIDINVSHIEVCTNVCSYFGKVESVKVNVGSGSVNSLLAGCKATTIDLSGWNTSNITDMSYLFSNCSNIEEIDVSGFNTSNVTSMMGMFHGCKKLKEINVSNFDTSNVTNMARMFSACESLEEIDISNFNTSSLITKDNEAGVDLMFIDSTALKKVKLCTIDAKNMTHIMSVFSGCKALEEVDMTVINSDNLTGFVNIFKDCIKLTKANVAIDTTNIKNMGYLFYNCRSLQYLDMSDWDLSSLASDTHFMFDDCYSLSEIKSPKNLKLEIKFPNYYWWMIDKSGTVCPVNTFPKNESESMHIYRNQLIGNVQFENEFKCGESVWAGHNVSAANGCTDTYTWYINDEPVQNYDRSYYAITADDYGKKIRVEITCNYLPGVVKSESHVVEYNDPPEWFEHVIAIKGKTYLSWYPRQNTPKYIVYRKVGDGEFEKIAVIDYNFYYDEDVVNGTTYTYAVRGVDANGKFMTDIDPVTQKITYYSLDYKLATPKLNSVKSTAAGVNVSWNEVADSKMYRVYKKNAEGVWEKLADTTNTSYVDADVAYNKEYSYTVSCVTVDGDRELSDYDENGVTVTYKLAAPVLSKVSSTATGAKVNWTAVEGAKTYRVFRKTPTGKWEKLGDTTKTAYTDKTAVNGKTYAYTVRCLSTTAQYISEYDKTGLTITYVNPDVTLANPVLKSVKNVSDGVSFAWNSTDGAVSYKVFRKEPGGSWKALGTTTKTTYTDKTVESGKTYVYTVRCVAEDGKTYMSAYDKTGLTIMYLAMPAVKVAKTTDGIKVSYGKIAGAKKYYVYRKTGDESWTRIATTTSTSYVDKTAKTKTTYYYTVKAVSDSYTSAYTSSAAISR